jgi:predicted Zn-dependent protease
MAISFLPGSCRRLRRVCTLVFAASLCACRPDAHEQLGEARAELAEAAYDDAIGAAEAGLRSAPDARTAWGLELVKLEAHARSGRGEQAIAQLEKIASLQPDPLPPTQYAATADQLRAAGDGAAAIQVLDLGARRHPDDPTLARLIGASRQGDVDPAELEMLRSLGYVE